MKANETLTKVSLATKEFFFQRFFNRRFHGKCLVFPSLPLGIALTLLPWDFTSSCLYYIPITISNTGASAVDNQLENQWVNHYRLCGADVVLLENSSWFKPARINRKDYVEDIQLTFTHNSPNVRKLWSIASRCALGTHFYFSVF